MAVANFHSLQSPSAIDYIEYSDLMYMQDRNAKYEICEARSKSHQINCFHFRINDFETALIRHLSLMHRYQLKSRVDCTV